MPERPKIEIKRMWDGGPLREWSPSNPDHHLMYYAKGGYVGSYVCDFCRNPCNGVYHIKNSDSWTCGSCKKPAKEPSKTAK